jgi:hypothetical protein
MAGSATRRPCWRPEEEASEGESARRGISVYVIMTCGARESGVQRVLARADVARAGCDRARAESRWASGRGVDDVFGSQPGGAVPRLEGSRPSNRVCAVQIYWSW